ncbi:FAD-dependent monooxygenase [Nonomuraea sp. NPDC050153]|uniref:aromatic-ring hydroxylase C-terminal domain-containing protein n=1 Tax=Nonomuraea sp. NPDC050153 TaxID=3364359 RepID=UPI00379BC41D
MSSPPTGSYGASTGIADAHNLAWKLAAVLNGAFVALVAPDGGEWVSAARTAAASLGVKLDIHPIGVGLQDPDDRFLDRYGITSTGMSLVRPDGFVGWRADVLGHQPEHELHQVLAQLLAREHIDHNR